MRSSFPFLFFLILHLGALECLAQNPSNDDIQNIITDITNPLANPFYPIPSSNAVNEPKIWFWDGQTNEKWSTSSNWKTGLIDVSGNFIKLSSVSSLDIPAENDIVIFYDLPANWSNIHVDGDFKCRRIIFSRGAAGGNMTDNLFFYIKEGQSLEVSDGIYYDTEKVDRSDVYLVMEQNSTLTTSSFVTEHDGELKPSFHEHSNSKSSMICDPSSTIVLRPRNDNDNISETPIIYLPEVLVGVFTGDNSLTGYGYGNLKLEGNGEDYPIVRSKEIIGGDTIFIKSSLFIDSNVILDGEKHITVDGLATVTINGKVVNAHNLDYLKEGVGTNPDYLKRIVDFETIEEVKQGAADTLFSGMKYKMLSAVIHGTLVIQDCDDVKIEGAPIKIMAGDTYIGQVIPEFSGDDFIHSTSGNFESFEYVRHYRTKLGRKKGWYQIGSVTKGQKTLEDWSEVVYTGIFQGGAESTVETYSEEKYANSEKQWTYLTDWSDSIPQAGLGFANFFLREDKIPPAQKGTGGAAINMSGQLTYSEKGELNLDREIVVPVTYTDGDEDEDNDNNNRNGYTLLANPFPFPITWFHFKNDGFLESKNGPVGYNRIRMRRNMFIYNRHTDVATIYTNQEGKYRLMPTLSNDPTKSLDTAFAIAPGQAFFVKTRMVYGTTNTFPNSLIFKRDMRDAEADASTATENLRVAKANESEKLPIEMFRLNLENEERPLYQTVMLFADELNPEFDEDEDAAVFKTKSAYIGSKAVGKETGEPIAIQFMPFPEQKTVVGLELGYVLKGAYTLRFHDAESIFKNKEIILKDKLTGQSILLEDSIYAFSIDQHTLKLENRFELIFSPKDYVLDAHFMLPDTLKILKDDIIQVPIRVKGLINCMALNAQIQFDQESLELVEDETIVNEGLRLTQSDLGEFSVAKYGEEGLSLNDGEDLAQLVFKVLKPVKSSIFLDVRDFKSKSMIDSKEMEVVSRTDTTVIIGKPSYQIALQVFPVSGKPIGDVKFSIVENQEEKELIHSNGSPLLLERYEGTNMKISVAKEDKSLRHITLSDWWNAEKFIEAGFYPNFRLEASMDLDGNDQLNQEDLKAFERVILGEHAHFFDKYPFTWLIFPERHAFSSNQNYQEFSLSEAFELKKNELKSFYAIQRGEIYVDRQTMNPSRGHVKAEIKQEVDSDGIHTETTLQMNSIQGLMGMQFTLEWNPLTHRLLSYDKLDEQIRVSDQQIENGKLPLLWTSKEGSESLENHPFIQLSFESIDDTVGALDLELNSAITESIAYRQDLTRMQIIQEVERVLSTPDSPKVSVYPNPVYDYVKFEIQSDRNQEAILKIYSLDGVIIEQLFLDLSDEKNEVQWQRKELSSGIYFWEIKMDEGSWQGKLLLK